MYRSGEDYPSHSCGYHDTYVPPDGMLSLMRAAAAHGDALLEGAGDLKRDMPRLALDYQAKVEAARAQAGTSGPLAEIDDIITAADAIAQRATATVRAVTLGDGPDMTMRPQSLTEVYGHNSSAGLPGACLSRQSGACRPLTESQVYALRHLALRRADAARGATAIPAPLGPDVSGSVFSNDNIGPTTVDYYYDSDGRYFSKAGVNPKISEVTAAEDMLALAFGRAAATVLPASAQLYPADLRDRNNNYEYHPSRDQILLSQPGNDGVVPPGLRNMSEISRENISSPLRCGLQETIDRNRFRDMADAPYTSLSSLYGGSSRLYDTPVDVSPLEAELARSRLAGLIDKAEASVLIDPGRPGGSGTTLQSRDANLSIFFGRQQLAPRSVITTQGLPGIMNYGEKGRPGSVDGAERGALPSAPRGLLPPSAEGQSSAPRHAGPPMLRSNNSTCTAAPSPSRCQDSPGRTRVNATSAHGGPLHISPPCPICRKPKTGSPNDICPVTGRRHAPRK